MFPRLIHAIAIAVALTAASSALAAEAYVFDRAHSKIRFHWDHFGFSTTSAEFEHFSGTLMYDQDDPTASSVAVTIDLASVDSGVEAFNGHLRDKAEWFNTDAHPRATFESTDIEATGADRYKVTGDLTMKGVTREVTLDTVINKVGQHPVSNALTIGLDATTTVKRSDFDMGQYAPGVSDEVVISISAEMPRQSDLED